MGCSTSDIEIEDIHKQIESPIGKLQVSFIKFQVQKAFHHRFQKINMLKFFVSNQEHSLTHDEIQSLQKGKKQNLCKFSYVINSLKKKYGRLLVIQLIVQKNGQLKEITEIIDINPTINLLNQQKSVIKTYFTYQKQLLCTVDLSLNFFQQPYTKVLLQILPLFKSSLSNQNSQVKFTLSCGQENLEKITKINQSYHKSLQCKVQVPNFLSKMILQAQYLTDNKMIKHSSLYEIDCNVERLHSSQIQNILDLNFPNISSLGKIIIKQRLAQKNTQNTTHSSKEILSLKKIEQQQFDATTAPSRNNIQTAKQIVSCKNIQTKLKSPHKVLLPPIHQQKQKNKQESIQTKFMSENVIFMKNDQKQEQEQEQDLRKYQISLKCISVV